MYVVYCNSSSGDDQFAAMLLFQLHGLVQGNNRALHLLVVRLAGGDALQPQAGRVMMANSDEPCLAAKRMIS